MAREIGQNDRLTVITSAFSVASELSTRRSVDVIQLGGMVRRSSLSVLGPFAEQMLGSLSCSKLFMGVDGVDLDYGVTTTNHIEASLHKQMIASVQKVIVLADSSKFGRRGFSKICDMSAVDQIITDDKAPASVIERLQESGVDVAAANRLRHRKERPGTESVPGRCVRGVRPREGRPSRRVTLACRRRRRRAPTR